MSLLLLQSCNTLTGLKPFERNFTLCCMHVQCHLEISATAAPLLALLSNDMSISKHSMVHS